jgi:hypothetical protein
MVLQGAALDAVHTLFISLMQAEIPDATYNRLLHALVVTGRSQEITKAGQLSIASCIAAITKAAGPAQIDITVNQLLTEVAPVILPTGTSSHS